MSENIVNAYKERGLTPPEHITAPPIVYPENYVFWEAFQDLQSERVARGLTPITAIIRYCESYRLDFDPVKRIIWKLDGILLKYWRTVDESKQALEKAESERKKSIRKTSGGQQ